VNTDGRLRKALERAEAHELEGRPMGPPAPHSTVLSADEETFIVAERATRRTAADFLRRPSAVRVDNGPEFIAQPFVDWCAEHSVVPHYIQPGKPIRTRISSVSIGAIEPKC
jgi:hypothetical protein